jgi:hypothetical protein
MTYKTCPQPKERASWRSALSRNLKSIKDRYSEQLIVKSSWLETIHFQNVCIYKMFCGMSQSALCNRSVDFVVLTNALLSLWVHNIHNYMMYVQWSIAYVYNCMYIYAPALECAAPTVFMVWQRAWFYKVREWFMRADASLGIIHASA